MVNIIVAGCFSSRVGSQENDEGVDKYGKETKNGSGETKNPFSQYTINGTIWGSDHDSKHIIHFGKMAQTEEQNNSSLYTSIKKRYKVFQRRRMIN